MSKKSLVQQIQPDPQGPVYGQVANPADFQKAQIFGHEHAEVIARDYVVGACNQTAVSGFDYQLLGGMQIRINAPGHVLTASGKSHEIIGSAPTDVTLAAAHATLPRIDLIVALVETDTSAAEETRPFVRLRTIDELEDGIPPYPPSQFNQPTELHNRATVQVKAGAAANPPVAPTLAANEVVLYSIFVPPGTTVLREADITDLRKKVASLCVLEDRVNDLAGDLNTRLPVAHRHPALDVDIGPGAGEWQGRTAQEFFNFFSRFDDDRVIDPLTRPETLTSDGKVGAVAALDGATPVVDIPVGTRVAFSDSVRAIEPGQFPASLNARQVNKSGSAGTETRTQNTNFSMAAIDSIESDGGGDFVLRAAKATAKRLSPASAARDGRYIEVYGGLGAGGLLSDWFTYDTLSDSVTARAITGTAPPAADRPAMFSCGDGVHVLLATAGSNGQTPRWFLCHTSGASIVVTEKFGGPTAGYQFFIGDLIQANIVFVVAVKDDGTKTFWVYHVDTGAFEQVNTAGPEPQCRFEAVDACLYQNGKVVLFDGNPGFNNADAQTSIFDYPTLTWARLQIQQPFNPFTNPPSRISQFRMANVNGRPMIAGGTLDGAGQVSAWELTPGQNPNWRQFNVSLPRRWQVGFASLIREGLPNGQGFVIAGRLPGGVQPFTDDIFRFDAAGIVETTFNGQPAITLSPTATQATFRVTDYAIDWGASGAAKVLATLVGEIPPGTVILSYSFDGVNFQNVTRDTITTVMNSAAPPTRILRITLISAGSAKPILSKLTEMFERTGGPSFNQVVIRYDAPSAPVTQALYIYRDGSLSISATIEQTTIDKALLVKSTHNGAGVNPTVKQYRNKRHLHHKFTAARAGGTTPPVVYDFAVAPSYKDARAITGGATGPMYKIPEPAINFDQDAAVTGVAADGDNYIVEVEA